MKRIFIASPFSGGDAQTNVDRQIDAANILLDHGFAPFAPLLCYYFDAKEPRDYEFWLEYTTVWIPKCDALLRLSGESNGADREVRVAQVNGIPVFFSMDSLMEYYK